MLSAFFFTAFNIHLSFWGQQVVSNKPRHEVCNEIKTKRLF